MSVNISGMDACVVGIDFGTLSGRALVVRVADGAELGSAVTKRPLHDYLGRGANEVMHRLRALRDRAISQPVGAQP